MCDNEILKRRGGGVNVTHPRRSCVVRDAGVAVRVAAGHELA